MCPYARFQSAMFDKDTLIISYDEARGEPRGARRRGSDAQAQGLGDCIDCTLCVQVCPTGIDIRKGLQYECIACAACIDACDEVMDKMAAPRGLIRYTTEHAMHGKPTHIVRPRLLRLWRAARGGGHRDRGFIERPHAADSRRHQGPQCPVPGSARRSDRELLHAQDHQRG